MARELISQSEYARRRKISQPMVAKEIRQGKYPKHRGGKVDPKEADALLAMSRDPAREPFLKGAEAGHSMSGYYTARTIRETYAARLAKLEYEQATSKLVDAEEVKKAASEMGRIIRDALLNLPDRLAPIIAAESNVHKVHALMMKEIRKCITSLAETNGHA